MQVSQIFRSKLIFWVNLAFGTGLFAWFLSQYGGGAWTVLQKNYAAPAFFGFILSLTAGIATLSWRWQFLLKQLTVAPGFIRMMIYRSAAHSLGSLIPSGRMGGDPLRAWLLTRDGVKTDASIASTVVDRTLELGSTAPFTVCFALLLFQNGLEEITNALITVSAGALALLIGALFAAKRLRNGSGLVSALARFTRAQEWSFVQNQMGLIEASEAATARLERSRGRLALSFLAGIVANLFVILEFGLLLDAFGLPTEPVAVVAAIFATGASQMLPIPASVGVLEGAQIWIFGMLGYPAEVGVAVALLVRMREMIWLAPGLVFLTWGPIRTARQRLSNDP
ncbi:MAG: lysylphosphatidylglycerol synthase transmembrane domain-containing protein [Myxococcota bacterium]|nr:lysylphosphatidylglycerol synthase transmembrane domain-containing protein [Myxococcota bacterium]